jgi:hypothetical protein
LVLKYKIRLFKSREGKADPEIPVDLARGKHQIPVEISESAFSP